MTHVYRAPGPHLPRPRIARPATAPVQPPAPSRRAPAPAPRRPVPPMTLEQTVKAFGQACARVWMIVSNNGAT